MILEDFAHWFFHNPSYSNCFETVLSQLEGSSRILCVGPFSLLQAYAAGKAGWSVDAAMLEEGNLDELRLLTEKDFSLPVHRAVEGIWDFIYAPMYINYIDKSELVDFLFDCRDSLQSGGRLALSFHDSLRPMPGEGRPVPLWFSDEERKTKYYTVEDILNTVSTLGFTVKGIEEVEGDGIVHAVMLDCSRV